MSATLPTTQKLSFSLDTIFNDNYDKTNTLESKIQTNNDMIRTYDNLYEKQRVKNASLQVIAIATLLIFIAVVLYYYDLIPSAMILALIVVGVIVLSMLIIYYAYYSNDYDAYLERINRNTQKGFEKKDKRPITDDDLRCDEDKEVDEDAEEEEIMFDPSKYNGKNTQAAYNKLLKTDSNYDVWANGDHKSNNPINENTKRMVDENLKANADSSTYDLRTGFDGLNPTETTFYDCEYTGANVNGMPIQKVYEKSTIPCHYYIDYKERAKYIKEGDTFMKV